MAGIKELGEMLLWESFYRYLLLSKTEVLMDLLPQTEA